MTRKLDCLEFNYNIILEVRFLDTCGCSSKIHKDVTKYCMQTLQNARSQLNDLVDDIGSFASMSYLFLYVLVLSLALVHGREYA